MKILEKLFGDENKRKVKKLRFVVEKTNALEPEFIKLSSDELKAKTEEFRERFTKGETLNDLMPEAFAAVREAAKRTLGQRHFDVQLIGGAVLHGGTIAEMRTGEGKTLTSTLPAYLNALSGSGVHVVTVNDYLARRDAVWMGQIFNALGMSVGVIQNLNVSYIYDPSFVVKEEGVDQGSAEDKERDTTGAFKIEYSYLKSCNRKESYKADITYGTNNEFGFDYLRDNMAQSLNDVVQRDHAFAIVDEVDSILIDEARTPLIISAPAEEPEELYYKFASIVESLGKDVHYTVDEKLRSVILTEAGMQVVETQLGGGNIYTEGSLKNVHHVEQALHAKALFQKDRHYIVEKNEIIIIDEFTGRKMYGRRYSEGLHQAIEAKEGVPIQRESQTLATITFQNYFRMYKKLSGMTGTAFTEVEEFWKIYQLDVTVVPTNKVAQRNDRSDRIYSSEEAKFKAVIKKVKESREKDQPVLIGTISIEKNEYLSELLTADGIPHEILNAKNHEREGEIIAQAGRPGAITLATNMAGRGVDIILGGNPPTAEMGDKVRTGGGLFVIGTERHESRRIDNQLRGRAGRQGDPGETQFFVSVDDDLMRIFSGDRMKKMMQRLKLPDDVPIENRLVSRAIEEAQKKVEGHNFDIRKHVLEYDDVLNKHREAIYKKRRVILDLEDQEKETADLRTLVLGMIEDEIERIVSVNTLHGEEWKLDKIVDSIAAMCPLTEADKKEILSVDAGQDKMDEITAKTLIIEKVLQVVKNNYEKIIEAIGDMRVVNSIERAALLRSNDMLWVEHLVTMDRLRTGIGLQGYGQRDPLVEYKKQAFLLFQRLQSDISEEVAFSFFKIISTMNVGKSVYERRGITLTGSAKTMSAGAGNKILGGAENAAEVISPVEHKSRDKEGNKVGRNDLCPCGSGKKYKKCHGA